MRGESVCHLEKDLLHGVYEGSRLSPRTKGLCYLGIRFRGRKSGELMTFLYEIQINMFSNSFLNLFALILSFQVESPRSPEFPPCIGYHPDTKIWGTEIHEDVPGRNCPPNHAFLGTGLTIGPGRPAGAAPVKGFCCPLPPETLEDVEEFASDRCSESSVATGTVRLASGDWGIVCTKINSARYLLGKTTPGAIVTTAEESLLEFFQGFYGRKLVRLSYPSLPIALRHGIGRVSRSTWTTEVCVGNPPGALLIGRSGLTCDAQEYRVLLAVPERSGDEPKPVPIISCSAIESLDSPEARCLP